jgi:nicotinate-nucleotide pyrophosphorylase (carboxylating)
VDKEFTQCQWGPLLEDDCRQLVRLAVREDLDQGYDWTTAALVPEMCPAQAQIVSRQPGVLAGLAAVPVVLQEMDTSLEWQAALRDGDSVRPGQPLGQLRGSARDLLAVERLLLNLVGRLSGIASLTAQFVAQIGHAQNVPRLPTSGKVRSPLRRRS